MLYGFIIGICCLCACLVAATMLILFVVNGRVQRNNERLELENRSLRRENKRLRDEAQRRGSRLASHLPRRNGW